MLPEAMSMHLPKGFFLDGEIWYFHYLLGPSVPSSLYLQVWKRKFLAVPRDFPTWCELTALV